MEGSTTEVATGTLGGLAWRRLKALDEPVRALLRGTNFCVVATLGKDGAVHAIPVWVDTDGDNVLLNSLDGRSWVRNIDRDPRVTCTIMNSDDPYEAVEIRGRVVERTYEGGNQHIHRLAKKYIGTDEYPWLQPGDKRILLKVAPEIVFHMRPGAPEFETASV